MKRNPIRYRLFNLAKCTLQDRRRKMMLKKTLLVASCLAFLSLFLSIEGLAQEDKIVQVAIETIRTQMRLPKGMEVKFVEKKDSPIPGFYSVKLILLGPDREIPVVVYVDEAAEKVILGVLFIKGENVTRKEAGEPRPRKIDMGQLEIGKSPFRGAAQPKVTIVEFSNFQCPYCVRSWKKMKELMERYPQDIKYVFKHYPLRSEEKTFELSEMVAASQEVSNEAFWVVHDFFFSDEGQVFVNGDKEVSKQKIEGILKEKGYDVKVFEEALETGKGKRRVEEDVAVGNKIPVMETPTTIVNGNLIGGSITDKTVERYLGK
jgi:protein-disulfide isomerase